MTKKKEPVKQNRQFDLRQGARTVSIGVRFTPKECEYIKKMASKDGISNAAVVANYFANWKENLGH